MPTPKADTAVEIYTTRWCGYCRAAKALLDRAGIAYSEVDVTNDPQGRDAIRRSSGWRTVPVVFLAGELVGGYTELADLDSRGGLDAYKAG